MMQQIIWHHNNQLERLYKRVISKSESRAIQWQDWIYIIGGGSKDDPYIQRINLITKQFESFYENTKNKYGHSIVLFNNSIFIFGGWDGQKQNDLWELTLYNNKLTQISCDGSIPSPRSYHSAVIYNGKMFVYGGDISMDEKSRELFAYTFATKKWDRVYYNSYAPSLSDHSAVVYKDCMYIYGGTLDETFEVSNRLYEFNFDTFQWKELCNSVGKPRRYHCAVLVDDWMYIFGGQGRDGYSTPSMLRYNFINRKWESCGDDIHAERHFHCVINYKNPSSKIHLLMFGGLGGEPEHRLVMAYLQTSNKLFSVETLKKLTIFADVEFVLKDY